MTDKQIVAAYRRSKTLPEGKTYADVYAAAKRIGKPFRGRPPAAPKRAVVKPEPVKLENVKVREWQNPPSSDLLLPTDLRDEAQQLRGLAILYRSAATKIDAALAALNGASK